MVLKFKKKLKNLEMVKTVISLKKYILQGERNTKFYNRFFSKLRKRQQKVY